MLTLSNIHRSFPGVRALAGVTFEARAGEIHALVGENGAGKSTLIKIAAGVFQPDEGHISFDGAPVVWTSPGHAKARGLQVIYQEFVLFPHLSAAENIFIGHERRTRLGTIDRGRTRADARDVLKRLGVDLDPRRLVRDLSVADQQMVEIAKALIHNVRVLFLDEPTAVISGHEVELLFERLRALRAQGVAIVYISHRLEEIFALCDRVTVLKDGQHVLTAPVAETTRERIVSAMVGRDLAELFPPRPAATIADRPIVLEARNVTLPGRVRDASIALRAGTITGLAGMIGSGRTELAMAIFGGLKMSAGTLKIDGRTIARPTPAALIALGVGLVSEDRKGQGLAMLLDVAANISAPVLARFSRTGLLDRARERQAAEAEIAAFSIACRGAATSVAVMSGGNQQKVLLARWARICRRVLILDEPTRGVDVGAKVEIYRIMRALAAEGVAVLMISSELPEIVGLSDHVVVMREGRVAGTLEAAAITEEAVMALATSHASGGAERAA